MKWYLPFQVDLSFLYSYGGILESFCREKMVADKNSKFQKTLPCEAVSKVYSIELRPDISSYSNG